MAQLPLLSRQVRTVVDLLADNADDTTRLRHDVVSLPDGPLPSNDPAANDGFLGVRWWHGGDGSRFMRARAVPA